MSDRPNPIDPDGLLEFSVVFTDRALNHMSKAFQQVMHDITTTLKSVYAADAVIVVPGGGTYAMEAVARQFATQQKCLVIRNGWFSYRWTQIFSMGTIPAESIVLKAQPTSRARQAPFAPPALEQVVETIRREKPAVVFAPHVETASGILLPEHYIQQVGEAVQQVGGLFVLDSIAAGALWVDMPAHNVDVLLSAPQKGWSASPCAGLVMLSARALAKIHQTHSSSFACDLGKWLQIMQAYENGGHAYHATLPTDALRQFRDAMLELQTYGFEHARTQQHALGDSVRALLNSKGLHSVAADGYQAPTVVVSYTDDADIHSGKKFADLGMQVAAGVPLQCDEAADYRSFRIGLFGLDKLQHPAATLDNLKRVLEQLF